LEVAGLTTCREVIYVESELEWEWVGFAALAGIEYRSKRPNGRHVGRGALIRLFSMAVRLFISMELFAWIDS